MPFSAPANFFDQLCNQYEAAVTSGNIFYIDGDHETMVETVDCKQGSFKVLYLLLASLLHRPEHGTIENDPFAKSEPELTVLDEYGPDKDLKVVLNKFPVVPRHFLLVTRKFVSQNCPLSSSELVATYSLLSRMQESDQGNRWFAFYNCGPHSGALQPHKHIQFMMQDPRFESFAEILASKSEPVLPTPQRETFQDETMPFAHFLARLPEDASQIDEESLVMCFASLLQRTLTVLRDKNAKNILYNAVITTRYMMLIPRRTGRYKNIGINTCGMIGMFLMKNQDSIHLVKAVGPCTIFAACGFPSTAGEMTTAYSY